MDAEAVGDAKRKGGLVALARAEGGRAGGVDGQRRSWKVMVAWGSLGRSLGDHWEMLGRYWGDIGEMLGEMAHLAGEEGGAGFGCALEEEGPKA